MNEKNIKKAVKAPSSPFQRIWNLFTTILLIVVVLFAVALVGVRIVGLQPFCVLGGSMEPTYHVGSLIYVQKVAPEEIKVNDPITFVMNEDLVVATHRVIRIDSENQRFYTQGDANDTEDGGFVHFKNLIGKPVFSIPYLGYVSNYLSSPPGIYVGIGVAVILVILMFIPNLFQKQKKEEKSAEKSAEKDEQEEQKKLQEPQEEQGEK